MIPWDYVLTIPDTICLGELTPMKVFDSSLVFRVHVAMQVSVQMSITRDLPLLSDQEGTSRPNTVDEITPKVGHYRLFVQNHGYPGSQQECQRDVYLISDVYLRSPQHLITRFRASP